jgi:branched-chain amino acid transport system permease protein
MSRAGPNLRTSYLESNEVVPRPYQKVLITIVLAVAILLPATTSTYFVHLLDLCFLSAIGALGLMLLTGYCGQISLGHAAFLAVGAFTTVILTVHVGAPFIVVLPAAALSGALLGFIVGLPSLRFRGVYLAISTLAMHYAIIYLATSYQANFGSSATAGITIPDPSIGPFVLAGDHSWYYFLLALLTLVTGACVNLARTRPGRAWMAIRDRDIAAQALGINLARFKLLAFVASSTLASLSGSLLAYYSNVVTVEKYTLDLAVTYVAMIIVGGMGSVLGALLGAMFSVQVGAVGVCIILFLLFEPRGLAEIWRRIETYFDRWPFRYRPLESVRR